MASIDSLLRRADAISAKLTQAGASRHWVFMLSEDQDIPPGIASQMQPHDTHFIEAFPHDYLSTILPDAAVPGSCVVMCHDANYVVSLSDGAWTKVERNWR